MAGSAPHLVQPRRLQVPQLVLVGAVLVALAIWGARRALPPPTRSWIEWGGETQGTTFSIRLCLPIGAQLDTDLARREAAAAMDEADRAMSLWRDDSEIARFNRAEPDDKVEVSEPLFEVARFARALAESTGGAFDPTMGPLLRRWGFGPNASISAPNEDDLRRERARTGWARFDLDAASRQMWKTAAGLELDLNAVAQGYTVDAVARRLRALGVSDFMVEIGGEVRVEGRNPSGNLWRIGIDEPRSDTLPGEWLAGILHLSGRAVATSGGYRKTSRNRGAPPVTHVLDGRTGRPVPRHGMSVTVVADDCLTADGLSTALFAMGPDEGLEWLRRVYPQADALFLAIRADGETLDRWSTPDFDRRTGFVPVDRGR